MPTPDTVGPDYGAHMPRVADKSCCNIPGGAWAAVAGQHSTGGGGRCLPYTGVSIAASCLFLTSPIVVVRSRKITAGAIRAPRHR